MSQHTAEMVSYAVAFAILVIGGMFLRTIVLNFAVGPMVVVACVAVLTPLLTRSEQRRRPR